MDSPNKPEVKNIEKVDIKSPPKTERIARPPVKELDLQDEKTPT
jgi:hypothetical protein